MIKEIKKIVRKFDIFANAEQLGRDIGETADSTGRDIGHNAEQLGRDIGKWINK